MIDKEKVYVPLITFLVLYYSQRDYWYCRNKVNKDQIELVITAVNARHIHANEGLSIQTLNNSNQVRMGF